MAEVPNRMLTPAELKELHRSTELKKRQTDLELEFVRQSQQPSKVFGWLLGALVVAMFIDIIGWPAAFLNGRLYAAASIVLQIIETAAILGIAGLAIRGSVESYRHQQALKKIASDYNQAEATER